MKKKLTSAKKAILLFFLMLCGSFAFAQLPQCDRIYLQSMDLFTGTLNPEIYSYDPALPVSATNPSLNTISSVTSSTGFAGGLTVSEVLGSGNTTLTFYTVINDRYWYYSPTTNTWTNTNHQTGSNFAYNIAAGGGFIYNLDGSTGKVYKYDGTGNGALLVTISDFAGEGPYDLLADCAGNFYILNATGTSSTPFLRKYNSNGVLTQSWTINNPSGYSPSGGFGIIGNDIYMDNIDFITLDVSIASGIINATSADLTSTTAALPMFGGGTAISDLGSCASGIPVLADITITASATTVLAGNSVTFTSVINAGGTAPQYQWRVNGVNVPGATGATFTYNPANGDVVTCELTSNLLCVININATSNAITMNVEECIPPTLSFDPFEYCQYTGEATPAYSPAGGTFTSNPAGAFLNNTTGVINLNTVSPGSYIITYTIPATTLCAALSTQDTILIRPSPSAEIKLITDGNTLCQNDTVWVRTANAPEFIYKWWPASVFPYGRTQAEVITKATPGYIYLSVTNEEGCSSTDSLDVKPEHCCDVMMPNAFSPNGDDINETFKIYANTAQDINVFSIYNRWGERIFYTNNQNTGWNGTHNNQPVDAGVYYYYLSYYCSDGKEMVKKGEVLLIR